VRRPTAGRGRRRCIVEIASLGAWARGARVLAEYDARRGRIRVDAAAVATIAARLGTEAARAFVRCAVAHEYRHARRPGAGEAEAHAFARRFCGVDPAVFEVALRRS